MPRPADRLARVVIMAAVLCVPVAGTAVAAWFLPTPAVAAVMVVSVAAAFVVVLRKVKPSGRYGGVAGACVVGASVAAMVAVPLLILRVRGEHDVATVTAERVASSRSGPTYKYRLVTASGRKIPGELSEPDDELSAGDRVSVVFDPRGVANPHDDDFVGLGLPLAGVTLALLVAAVVLSIPATGAEARGGGVGR